MSLEEITPNASVERHGYHELSEEQLRLKDDPEALFERGTRLRHGIGVRANDNTGWELIISSAKLGHPVALALCFKFGKLSGDVEKAAELLRDSASRGHVAGIVLMLAAALTRKQFLNLVSSTNTSTAKA
jgi:hypothetical protein